MGKRRVEMIILCEDAQHEAFARRFAALRFGTSVRDTRVERGDSGRGCKATYVRHRFPKELKAVRARSGGAVLVAVIDEDGSARRDELKSECEAQGVPWIGPQDGGVLILVPARRIETWVAYLDGKDVDEKETYPKLGRERDCQAGVEKLVDMCDKGQLRSPAPPSLQKACEDFASFDQAVRSLPSR